jgi:hypothetical protein
MAKFAKIFAVPLILGAYLVFFQSYWAAEPVYYYEFSQTANSTGAILAVSFKAENCSQGDQFCLRNAQTGELISKGQVNDNSIISFSLGNQGKERKSVVLPGKTYKLSVCKKTTLAGSLMASSKKPKLSLNSEAVALLE